MINKIKKEENIINELIINEKDSQSINEKIKDLNKSSLNSSNSKQIKMIETFPN